MKGSAAITAAVPTITGCGSNETIPSTEANSTPMAVFDDGTLAGKTPEQIHEKYRHYLFEDFLPFHYKYVIDHEYGGFMCNTNRDGSNITTKKLPGSKAGEVGHTLFSTTLSTMIPDILKQPVSQ